MAIVTITGSNVSGGSPGGGGPVGGATNLTTTGAVPYVSSSGVLSQDGSLLRSATGQYTLYDQTATTGVTKLAIRCGAGQAFGDYLLDILAAAGTRIGGIQYLGGAVQITSLDLTNNALWAQASASNVQVATNGVQFSTTTAAASGSYDAGVSRNAAGIVEVNSGTVNTYRDLKFRNRICTVGANLASAATIAPTESVHHVTGVTTISTITAPPGFAVASAGGQITLIPDGLWATNTAGNIALATTAVVGKALILTYDNATSKWYPSY